MVNTKLLTAGAIGIGIKLPLLGLRGVGAAYKYGRANNPKITGLLTGGAAAYGAGAILSPIAEHQREVYLSRHGDTERNRKVSNTFGAIGTVTSAAIGIGVGLGVGRNRGPKIARPSSKVNAHYEPRAKNYGDGSGPYPMPRAPHMPRAPRMSSKEAFMGSNFMASYRTIQKSYGAVKKHPYITAFGASALGGVGVGAGQSVRSPFMAAEGNITAIGSSPAGGISPELQFSTQGLPLSIHNRRKDRGM